MRKKRPMFLLEILIALTLVSLCIVPFIKQPLEMHKAEMKRLERVECDRIAAWTFTELKEKFLKKEFRWEQIPQLYERSVWINLPTVELRLPPIPCPSVSRKFYFSTLEEKQESDGKIHRLVAIHMQVKVGKNKRKFTYRLILTKHPTLAPVT